jgi:hypothetical protein
MFLVSKELAPFIATDHEVGVKYDSGPVEPLPICFSHKHACAYVTTTNP